MWKIEYADVESVCIFSMDKEAALPDFVCAWGEGVRQHI